MNQKNLFTFALALILGSGIGFSQDKVHNTFRDNRIVNGHSVEMSTPGELKFTIGHRFGPVNSGWRDLWGIDQANVRFGLDYGVTKNLTIGFGRSQFMKTYDGYVKLRLLQQDQGSGLPFSVVYLGTIAHNAQEVLDPDLELAGLMKGSYRNAFTHQLLIASKISDRLSVQLMPTFLHRNLVRTAAESNDVIAIGAAGRYQIFRSLAINAEYYYVLPDQLTDINTNPIAIGFDIETSGHVFQLHLTNSAGMIERFFLTETVDDFLDGGIRPGFNISRIFVIRGRQRKSRKSNSYKE